MHKVIKTLGVVLLCAFGACSSTPTEPGFEVVVDDLKDGTLNAAWSFGPGKLVVVGGTPGHAAVLRLDGDSWKRETVPAAHILWWVHAFHEDDIWVVGEGGAILRWQGSEWARIELQSTVALAGVWGANPDDVWVVGGRPRVSTATPRVWRVVQGVPEEFSLPETGTGSLLKAWGDELGNVYFVGQHGKFLVYDGTETTVIDSGVIDSLVTVMGGPDGAIYAVGGFNRGVILRYDQGDVTLYEAPTGLMGLTFDVDGAMWVSGRDGYIARSYDFGATLERINNPSEVSFHGVAEHVDGMVALGGNLMSALYDLRGALVHFGPTKLPAFDLEPLSFPDAGFVGDVSVDGTSGTDSGVVSDTIVEPGGFCGASSDGVCTSGYSCESLAFDQICTENCAEDADCSAVFGDEACCLAPPDMPGIPSPGAICHPELFCNGAGW